MNFTGVRAFARHMLQDNRLLLRPLPDSCFVFGSVAMEGVLFREGCWQVELASMPPDVRVPKHRHNRVDSADLLLFGGGVARVAGGENSARPRGALAANLVLVPRGVWHEGESGPAGVMYLSFQRWHDGPVGLLSDDWEAA